MATCLTAWSHQGRLTSEAAFAALAGVNPIPASSGNTVRHRLNRGGDRRLNKALHTIALTPGPAPPPENMLNAGLTRRTHHAKSDAAPQTLHRPPHLPNPQHHTHPPTHHLATIEESRRAWKSSPKRSGLELLPYAAWTSSPRPLPRICTSATAELPCLRGKATRATIDIGDGSTPGPPVDSYPARTRQTLMVPAPHMCGQDSCCPRKGHHATYTSPAGRGSVDAIWQQCNCRGDFAVVAGSRCCHSVFSGRPRSAMSILRTLTLRVTSSRVRRRHRTPPVAEFRQSRRRLDRPRALRCKLGAMMEEGSQCRGSSVILPDTRIAPSPTSRVPLTPRSS